MAEIDFDACMRYVRGESPLAEAKAVRAWLKEPANKLTAQHWMGRHMATLEADEQAVDPAPFNYAGMQATLGRQLGFDVPPAVARPAARRRWAMAAAIAGIAAGVGGGLYWQQHAPPGAVATRRAAAPAIQYATGNGQTRVVQLPDGSTVTLNANSTLRYAAGWSPTTPREV
ncbi:MAG: hypothetical protein ACRYFZ_07575 [Janthinobacterium lividum]